jgi:CO/xanthine dehydrogenase Mo-binding subunit
MTEMLNKEFSRKSFVKAGGALVVGYSALAGTASAANGLTPMGQRGPQDYLPSQQAVDSWITLTADNTVIVTHGETEQGHGTPTGILQLVAEEMDMGMDQMIFAPPETWLQAVGGGSGSGGISSRSTAIRAAAATARNVLLGLASTQLGVPVAQLTTNRGVVTGGGKSVKYSDLLGGKMFNTTMTGQTTATPGQGIAKPVSQYKVVGKYYPRIDIPDKVAGKYTYIQNVRIAGMVHARSVRPRGAGANTSQNHFPLSIDKSSIKHIPGAEVVQINNFVAVVAPKEYDAIQAAAQLKVVWKSDPKLPGSGNFWGWLRQAGDSNTQNVPRYTTDSTTVQSELTKAAKTVSATYMYQYNSFMPIGPHCAIADVRMDQNRATVWLAQQALNGLPNNISGLTGIPAANCRVIFHEGASSFGGGQSAEVYEQAVILSKHLNKPVRMQWMRWDQHGWDHAGVANMYDVTMGVNAQGKIVAADWQTYGQAQQNIDTTKELLGPNSGYGTGATWPATPGAGGVAPTDSAVYNTGYARRVLAKTQPLYGGAFRCNFLRAPNAPQQYFASEQIVDELAYAMKMDPVAFRRLNIDGSNVAGARWLAAMDAATQAAGWKPKVAASSIKEGNLKVGRGFGFGQFAGTQSGIVADVEVDVKTGKIVAKHLYISQVNGITIGPDLVGNQMSGSAIQGLSRALYEQYTFTKERITSLDWVTYPILRFKDSPKVTLVNAHPGIYTEVVPGNFTTDKNPGVDVSKGNTAAVNANWPLSGSGEPPTAPIGSAIANAFFDATGVRIRQAPMNPTHVRAALKAAGYK